MHTNSKAVIAICCVTAAITLIIAWFIGSRRSWAKFEREWGDDLDDEEDEYYDDFWDE